MKETGEQAHTYNQRTSNRRTYRVLDVRRRGRAGAWVTCGLRAGGGRDGGPSSRFGAVLSQREFRRTIGDGGGRGRAGAWGTFGFCLNFEF